MEDAAELRERRTKGKRKKQGQKWLAECIGVSASMVSQYEHGKATPSLWIADRYAKALRVPLQRLVDALAETNRRAEAERAAKNVTSLQAERERRQQSN